MKTRERGFEEGSDAPKLATLPCACANLRRAARAVTQLYDRELRGTGVGVTQFTLLQALARVGEVSQGRLGDALSIDSTTLTRTLANLRKAGWVAIRPGSDRRVRLISVTDSGRRQLEKCYPAWEHAQERLRGLLGDQRWERLGEMTHNVVRFAREA